MVWWLAGWLAAYGVQINHMLFRLMHTRGEEMEEPGALPLSSALLLGHPHPGSMSSASGWLTAEMLARQGAEVRGKAGRQGADSRPDGPWGWWWWGDE